MEEINYSIVTFLVAVFPSSETFTIQLPLFKFETFAALFTVVVFATSLPNISKTTTDFGVELFEVM